MRCFLKLFVLNYEEVELISSQVHSEGERITARVPAICDDYTIHGNPKAIIAIDEECVILCEGWSDIPKVLCTYEVSGFVSQLTRAPVEVKLIFDLLKGRCAL